MRVRVPAIVEGVLAGAGQLEGAARRRVRALAAELRAGERLPPLTVSEPDSGFAAALGEREGQGWLDTDWLFAETYAYRQLMERSGYFATLADPFFDTKLAEYRTPAHARAFERAAELAGSGASDPRALLLAALFGNRIDLSFAASLARGLESAPEDLLLDDLPRAAAVLGRGRGPVHLVADNAGTELTFDLALVDWLLHQLGAPVVLHVKAHPTFVSDATPADVVRFVSVATPMPAPPNTACDALLGRLRSALADGRLRLSAHEFWTGPGSLWDLPADLSSELAGARLVILKGDANYRRAVGDALWPSTTPFAEVTQYFPAPLLALRMLKSDPIVGLAVGQAERLSAVDPEFRVNGKRGVASLGGLPFTRAASDSK